MDGGCGPLTFFKPMVVLLLYTGFIFPLGIPGIMIFLFHIGWDYSHDIMEGKA